MFYTKALQALRVALCMIAIGFFLGFLYEELLVKDASVWLWAGGIISLIGWVHLFWMAAFSAFRTNKKR